MTDSNDKLDRIEALIERFIANSEAERNTTRQPIDSNTKAV